MEKALIDYKAYLQTLIDGYTLDLTDDSGWGMDKKQALEELSKNYNSMAVLKADEILEQQDSNVFLGALSDKLVEVSTDYHRKLMAKFK